MIAGSRRRATVVRSRKADPDASLRAPPDDEAPKLRLAMARGRLGLELERPCAVGPVRVVEASVALEDLRFPLDLSGGVARFRHRRGRLVESRWEIDLPALGRWVAPRLRGLLSDAIPRVTLAPCTGGVLVGIAHGERALAFEVLVAPLERDLRLIVESPRGEGLLDPAWLVASRALVQALGGLGGRGAGVCLVQDPFGRLVRAAWPLSGARAPSTVGGRVALEDAALGASAIALTLRADEAPPMIPTVVIRAVERAELAAEAEAAALDGDLDRARARLLGGLERAPRHPALARALAELDARGHGRFEAALATLVDVCSAVDAGVIGSEVLEAVGEIEAAHVAAARAAAAEVWGPLAGLSWLRAARLAHHPSARRDAIEQALLRAPSLELARWARLEERLGHGELAGGLADAEHLEASAPDLGARHDVARRVAALLHRRGYLTEARARYERALRWAPESAEGLAGLARTLRDLGRPARALDLFARAVGAAESRGAPASALRLELAEALVAVAQDRPAAIARVATITPDDRLAAEARWLEARWRFELGDHGGARRAVERLRDVAERLGGATRPDVARRLEDAGALLADELHDRRAAERTLALALSLDPDSPSIARRLRALGPGEPERSVEGGRVTPDPAPPEAEPAIAAPPAVPEEPVPTPDEDEAAVERLAERLRGDPGDHVVAKRLADALERLGRDMELLALVSARLEESPPPEVVGSLERRRSEVLARLAIAARAAGRLEEASLYEMMGARPPDDA